MSIEVDVTRKELAAALKFIGSSINDSAAKVLSIAGCVKIKKSGTSLLISGTDGQASVFADIACEDSGSDGEIVVSVGKLRAMLDSFSSERVSFKVSADGGSLHVYSGSADLTLQVVPVESFPDLEMPSGTEGLTMSAAEFTSCVKALQNIPPDKDIDSRYYINGILIKRTATVAHADIVATDGKRIGYCKAVVDPKGDSVNVMVPVRLIRAIASADGSDYVSVYPSVGKSSHIGLCVDGKFYVTTPKLADMGSAFPAYEKFIAKIAEATAKFTVDAEKLMELVARATIVADGDYSVTLDLNGSTLSVSSGSSNKLVEELDLTTDFDGQLRIYVHAVSLKQAVQSLQKRGDIHIDVISETMPMFFSDDPRNMMFVIAPVIK